MMTKNLCEELQKNVYPGRGIVLGKSADGKNAVIAYFIMGRSENSRNRVFEALENSIDGMSQAGGLRTKAFDESKMTDPSLIIYRPVLVCEDSTVVTNGDQTDTVCDFLKQGKTFEDALRTREFEPDAPNFTPRISGILNNKTGDYRLSILKSALGDPSSVRRFFYEYENPLPGQGHFIHTYEGDGNPLPSFTGEPAQVEISGEPHEFASGLWAALNAENKVSLFVRFINLETGVPVSHIYNKHGNILAEVHGTTKILLKEEN